MVRTETCSLPEALTANYVLQLLTTLDHIHDHNFIHRDIKPENIWLKNNSRKVVLTNFEQSCKVKNRITDRRNTFCGTMEYLSPEMIEKSGHNYKTDVWMLGILTYEMLFGFSPFASENEDILDFASETYANILYNDVFVSDNPTDENMLTASKITTENLISHHGKDFIRIMLSKDPADRDEISELVKHDWFKEQLGLAKWSQMKQGYDKQKEASNTTISMGTKFGQGSKTDLENILQNSKLDETGPFHNAHFIRPNQNIILDDLQENIERRFSENSEADSMFSLNIEMVSCIGAPKPNQPERYPRAMSAFHGANFLSHKRATSIHPDNMTILESIQQTPRGKTSNRPLGQPKGMFKLNLDEIRIGQSENVSPRDRRPEQIIRKLQGPNLVITECDELEYPQKKTNPQSALDEDVLQYDSNGNKCYKGGLQNTLRHGHGVEYKTYLPDPIAQPGITSNYAFYKGPYLRGFKHGSSGLFKIWDSKAKEFFEIFDCKLEKDDLVQGKMMVTDDFFGLNWYVGGFNENFLQDGSGCLMGEGSDLVVFEGKWRGGLKNGNGKRFFAPGDVEGGNGVGWEDMVWVNGKKKVFGKRQSIVEQGRPSKLRVPDEKSERDVEAKGYCGGGCVLF